MSLVFTCPLVQARDVLSPHRRKLPNVRVWHKHLPYLMHAILTPCHQTKQVDPLEEPQCYARHSRRSQPLLRNGGSVEPSGSRASPIRCSDRAWAMRWPCSTHARFRLNSAISSGIEDCVPKYAWHSSSKRVCLLLRTAPCSMLAWRRCCDQSDIQTSTPICRDYSSI